jgi:putative tryptophan/tyrosine transport system substrate-binding protein
MKRRQLMILLGSAAALPFVARAQHAMPVIGFLHAGSPDENKKRLAAFRKGLADLGFVEAKVSRSNTGGPKARARTCRLWPPT